MMENLPLFIVIFLIGLRFGMHIMEEEAKK